MEAVAPGTELPIAIGMSELSRLFGVKRVAKARSGAQKKKI